MRTFVQQSVSMKRKLYQISNKIMKEFLVVFLGGGLGSAMRYGVQILLNERITPNQFPWPTFLVNILGSFLIGLFYAWSARWNLSAEVRLLLTTGLCGGFTTFSTFCNDGLQLLNKGFVATFCFYFGLSLLLGILAVMAGAALGKG